VLAFCSHTCRAPVHATALQKEELVKLGGLPKLLMLMEGAAARQ